MSDLATTYLGLDLTSPLVVAASPVSSHIDRIKQAEDSGAGAIVIRSLFEEQVHVDERDFEEQLASPIADAEMTDYTPELHHGGTRLHLYWVEKTRKAVSIPLIGSVNAESPGAWIVYSQQLADVGCDAIELNVYGVPREISRSSAEIEDDLYQMVSDVVRTVSVPVSVKLSPFYANVGNVVHRLGEVGAAGVVLFNRFLQPGIDPDQEDTVVSWPAAGPADIRLPLRWIALLAQRTALDLSLSTGVRSGKDVAATMLAGATTAQLGSILLERGVNYLGTILAEFEAWMEEHAHTRLTDVRGTLAAVNTEDPFAFERAQYVDLLLR